MTLDEADVQDLLDAAAMIHRVLRNQEHHQHGQIVAEEQKAKTALAAKRVDREIEEDRGDN